MNSWRYHKIKATTQPLQSIRKKCKGEDHEYVIKRDKKGITTSLNENGIATWKCAWCGDERLAM